MLNGLDNGALAARGEFGVRICLMARGMVAGPSQVIRELGLLIIFRGFLLAGKVAFILLAAICMTRRLLKLVIYRPLLALEAT